MQQEVKNLCDAVAAAQDLANSPELLALPSLNEARNFLKKAMFVAANYARSAQEVSQHNEAIKEELDETTVKIRAAEKFIVHNADGTKSIGNNGKTYRGDIPQKPLLEYYNQHIAKSPAVAVQPDAVVNEQPQDSEAAKIPTTGTPNVAVKDEADYQAKKNMLANCSEDFKKGEAYQQIAEAIKAYELATGADKPTVSRREEMEILLPALDITDEEIAKINDYAKTVGIDSIKKKYSADQLNAVLIMLYGASVVDSVLGAARKLHAIHHPENA